MLTSSKDTARAPETTRSTFSPTLLVLLLLLVPLLASCQGNDLSLPNWGPYAVDQMGPVLILNKAQGHAIQFPIVVGQANGVQETRNLRFHDLWWDDRPGRQITGWVLGKEANRDLSYWSYRVLFRPTQFRDWTVPNLPGWEHGEAKVECVRVLNDMIVAVTFRNDDEAVTHNYFLDLLGGFDDYYQTLLTEEAVVHKDASQGWMAIEHPGVNRVFAVKASGALTHLFDIRDRYFYPGTVSGTGGLGMHDHGTYVGDGQGWWMDVNMAGIEVGPGQERTVFLVIKQGPNLDLAVAGASSLLGRADTLVAQARASYAETRYAVTDPAYRASMEHAASQILINTVFNGRTEYAFFSPARQRYFTPSRYYSSFHHWDAGCTSIGLMEYDTRLAAENVGAALPDQWPWGFYNMNPQPPTAIFSLWELYQRTGDISLLNRFYPAARNWYLNHLFTARSGDEDWLLNWHGEGDGGEAASYAMNSGMEDLPVWQHARAAGPGGSLRHVEAPCLQSLTIRTARILRMTARALGGRESHMAEYGVHIDRLRAALQTHMWHAGKGVFAPVWQDDKSFVPGYEDTIIGVYPLFAGADIITDYQRERILQYMTDPDTLWSGFGLRTVSRSAPYYASYVGWGGSVWIVYQWFVWKGLLAHGETDLARELAWQVLENFRANHEERSYLSEMWDGDTGLSTGAKDFTGLSSPIINLHASYTTPGRVSTGWDVFLHETAYDRSEDRLRITADASETPGPAGFVAVMGEPNRAYTLSGSSGTREVFSDDTGAVSFVENLGVEPVEILLQRAGPPTGIHQRR